MHVKMAIAEQQGGYVLSSENSTTRYINILRQYGRALWCTYWLWHRGSVAAKQQVEQATGSCQCSSHQSIGRSLQQISQPQRQQSRTSPRAARSLWAVIPQTRRVLD